MELQNSHSLTNLLSHGVSVSSEDVAPSQGHDGVLCWANINQEPKHAIKWIINYVPQEFVTEHEDDQLVFMIDLNLWRACLEEI